jgi:hypothetical protein
MPKDEPIGFIGVYCMEVKSLFPIVYILHDCKFTMTLNQGDPSFGGHNHNSKRPLGGLRLPVETGSGQEIIEGRTGGDVVGLEYIAPQASGEVEFVNKFTPTDPNKFRCLDCEGRFKWKGLCHSI